MTKPYLGELILYWCIYCDLPILGKTCGCGAITKKVDITPPGDIRPAFQYDIDLINHTTKRQFGITLIQEGRLVVLNKAPYEDRMDEVILHGMVMGSIRFELECMEWVFIPRIEGANLLKKGKRWVIVDKDAVDFILKGASVLAPGVQDAEASIKEGDEVIVLTPKKEVIAVGRARMSAEQMLTHKKGMAVKTRWYGRPKISPSLSRKRTWEDAVAANLHILKKLERKAHSFIKNVVKTTKKPVSVSYSGGKDSLATLLLVKDCVPEFDMLFADTGLEFPETLNNVKETAEQHSLPLKICSSDVSFWKAVQDFGPPTVEARWCCKVCKLGAITQLIEHNYENGCLTFIGQRKYESEVRANSHNIWKNPWVSNQIGASPIQNWTALHVWLYLFWKKARYNSLYEKGFERIGCWLCPSASMADFLHLKKTHPELSKRLEDYLLDYATKHGLSKEWVVHGFWRYNVLPKSMRKLAEKKGISYPPMNKKKLLSFSITSGYIPCRSGGITAEGSFGTPLNLSLIEETGILKVIGNMRCMEGVIFVWRGEENVQVYASGTLVARGKHEHSVRNLIELAEKAVRRALLCKGCGVCVGKCTNHAIRVNNKAHIDEKCTHCGKCISTCPTVRFA